MYKRKSGIYKITNLVTNKFYIGSAICLSGRKNTHFNLLRKGVHANRYLQFSFNKHGKDNFLFEVVEYVTNPSLLIQREQYHIDFNKCFNRTIGYNISPTAGSNLGMNSPLKGTKRPKEFIESIKGSGNPFFGRTHTNEVKESASKRMSGKGNPFFGKTHTDEFRKKSSAIHKGKLFSDELRKKLSEAGKGRKQSKDHIANRVASSSHTVWVIDTQNGVFYAGIKEAARFNGYRYGTLYARLNEKRGLINNTSFKIA